MDIDELKNFIMSGGSSSDEDDGVHTKRSRKQVNDEDVSFDGFSVGLEFERSEDGDGYIVVGAGFCGDIDLKIPEDYGGLPVVAIGDGAFKGDGELTRVFLPKSVLHIGEQAFADCGNLIEIDLSNVKSVGANAFEGCNGLIEREWSICYVSGWVVGYEKLGSYPNFRKNTIGIADRVFENAAVLVEVKFPSSLKHIGKYAFNGCKNLGLVEIPDGVTDIREHSFSGCSSLRQLTLPYCLVRIGERAFLDCVSLDVVDLPSGVSYIADSAFFNCGVKTFSVDPINKKYKVIDYALCTYDGERLLLYPRARTVEYYSIPDSVKEISSLAFCGCDSLRGVFIHKDVLKIGANAFYGCRWATLYCEGKEPLSGWDQNWGEGARDFEFKHKHDTSSGFCTCGKVDASKIKKNSKKSKYGSAISYPDKANQMAINRRRFLPCRLIAFFGTLLIWFISSAYINGIGDWANGMIESMGFESFFEVDGGASRVALVLALIVGVLVFIGMMSSDSDNFAAAAIVGIIALALSFLALRLIMAVLGYIVFAIVNPAGTLVISVGCSIALGILKKRLLFKTTKFRVILRMITMNLISLSIFISYLLIWNIL